MSKEEYSRSYQKKRLKNFWKTRWIPGRNIDIWLEVLSKLNMNAGRSAINARVSSRVILDAVEKLYLEKKITEDEKINLTNMLKSPDQENRYIALVSMYNLKPKAFERRK